MALAAAPFVGHKTHRLIASRFPTIDPFDYMRDIEDIKAAVELEGATNDRLFDFEGRLALIPKEDLVFGIPSFTFVMAAFLHGQAGRFNDATLGAWYAALEIETAIAETAYHHTRRLLASSGGFPARIEMRELIATPGVALVDIRAANDNRYHLIDYALGQEFGRLCKAERMDGIWYRSVRREGGENVVLFKPHQIVPVTQGRHLLYAWDRNGDFKTAELKSTNL